MKKAQMFRNIKTRGMLSVIIMLFVFLSLNMKKDQSFFIFLLAKHVNDDKFAHKKVLRIKYAKMHFSIFKTVLIFLHWNRLYKLVILKNLNISILL